MISLFAERRAGGTATSIGRGTAKVNSKARGKKAGIREYKLLNQELLSYTVITEYSRWPAA